MFVMLLTHTPSFLSIRFHLLFDLEAHLLYTIINTKTLINFKHLINDIVINLKST